MVWLIKFSYQTYFDFPVESVTTLKEKNGILKIGHSCSIDAQNPENFDPISPYKQAAKEYKYPYKQN